ncbi:ADP-ribosylglycohydrolase family protein [Nocardia sp. alder85J]|uniref:ADP-ribosylglycohydrolase family protein n=1 Tax=Nocardia sp. alder85J TaxID=2862949 RepID=UPI001CD4EB79|nr:ADP-ribosylglycohydrolase family protein [Nocardia sp. alder85J]MCX4092709.1 ADP-ribosylglycohydrolase family protein [Nocardia sp. alder85J]
MRDPRIKPKGWPSNERARRGLKHGNWHSDWSDRWRNQVDFRPDSRTVEDSDYNQHYVDIEAPIRAELEYSARSDEIAGYNSDFEHLIIPTGSEKLRGAIVGAGVGDAFADDFGGLTTYPWYSGGAVDVEEKLIDYLPNDRMLSSWVGKLMAYSAEGLIRALGVRRFANHADPVSTVQHAYQRWLYHMQKDWDPDKSGEWRKYGGPYARNAGDRDEPGGTLSEEAQFRIFVNLPDAIIDALTGFATSGIMSTPTAPRSAARGPDVLIRGALAAVWSEDLSQTFDLAVSIAALTHPHPDDFLPAGVLAVILHQQIRGHPFMDCLTAGYLQLTARPGHQRTRSMIDTTVALVRNEWTPTQADNLRKHFPHGGIDGAEGLGIALYCAMVSDYLREALVLALNYAPEEHRCQVAATTGMLIGAEYGIQAIPAVFRDPVQTVHTLDRLGQDLATELRDVLDQSEWQRRYPPN